MARHDLIAEYTNSHALIIGVDNYNSFSPLKCAVNDAEGIAELLNKEFEFPEEHIHLLRDEEATRQRILEQYLSFTQEGTEANDRVIFFFAGHGHTLRSRRGEVGYLVPYDGDPSNLASLIRWDEITRNSHLIEAKHIFFLMDACYGGLAVTRLNPGSMRFLGDMLLRPARQALSAGKADEPVVDIGGPLPDHSMFSGYLIEGLSGKASHADGIMTANSVMTYVYQKVGLDQDSQQTPHYGYIDGEGDMIFRSPELSAEEGEDGGEEKDILFSVPALTNSDEEDTMNRIDQIKEMLSEDRHRIKLRDIVIQLIREVISQTTVDQFPIQEAWTTESFADRVAKYESVMQELCATQILLCYWGGQMNRETLALSPRTVSGRFSQESGSKGWLALRWYPSFLLLYYGGISAVAAEKYDNLREMLKTRVSDHEQIRGTDSFDHTVCTSIAEVFEQFKYISGNERHHAPHSEYLFKTVQPLLDDLLFLGSSYETYFDRFEALLGLIVAEERDSHGATRIWGPIGRYGWKFKRGDERSLFHGIVTEAAEQGQNWGPIRAGLFRGSIDRFMEISEKFSAILKELPWF